MLYTIIGIVATVIALFVVIAGLSFVIESLNWWLFLVLLTLLTFTVKGDKT